MFGNSEEDWRQSERMSADIISNKTSKSTFLFSVFLGTAVTQITQSFEES